MTISDCLECEGRSRRDDRQGCECTCRLIESLVAAALGIGVSELRGRSRGRAAVAFARQTAMYLAHVHFGISLSQVGRTFGRDRTTVAHACARVEDRRDDPRFEHMLRYLERALDGWQQNFLTAGAAL
jgi:chromosomal replication initiation ATPase DnaA